MLPHIELTKNDLAFPVWYSALKVYAKACGGSAAYEDAWRDDYEMGRSPKEAWIDAWEE